MEVGVCNLGRKVKVGTRQFDGWVRGTSGGVIESSTVERAALGAKRVKGAVSEVAMRQSCLMYPRSVV